MGLENIIVPVVTALIGAFATWFVQKNLQEKRDIEKRLSEKRQEIYTQILNPYIKTFSKIKSKDVKEAAIYEVTSFEYRKTAFELNLIGSDDVIIAYNNLMLHAFEAESAGEKKPVDILGLWGKLLLEIRRNLGNKNTKLDEWDMLKGMIKDLDAVRGYTNDKR